MISMGEGKRKGENTSIYNSDKKALKRAEEMYNKALKYDSTFALAYIGLGRVYMQDTLL